MAQIGNITQIGGFGSGGGGGGAVDSVNGQTGIVTLQAGDSSIPSVDANVFVYGDAANKLNTLPGWTVDPSNMAGASNVQLTYRPNALALAPNAFNWNVNVDPLQDSPDDGMQLHSFNVNLDSGASGFNFGGNGEAGAIHTGGFNYGGNGATFGTLRHVNFFSGFGDGTNPGTVKSLVASSHALDFSDNMTIDGPINGYDFNLHVHSGALPTSNFNVIWMSDFSTIQSDLYGYQGIVCQPNIDTIKIGNNFNGISIDPVITTMEGNAGFYPYTVGGSITTLGTRGFQGFGLNTSIGTVPAGSNVQGIGMFNTITSMAATSSFQGIDFGPIIGTLHGNFNGYNIGPQIAAGDGPVQFYSGNMGNVTTTGDTSVMNLSGLTANGKQSAFNADGVRMNIGGRLDALSNQSIQGQHIIFTEYHTPAGVAVTGTDVLMNILSPDVDFGSNTSSLGIGPSNLGSAFVVFAGQMHGHGQCSQMSALLPTAIFSEDFTLDDWRNVDCTLINAGYTGTCTNATAFYHEVAGAGLFATNHWGLRVVSDVDNYVTKMAINTANQKATSPFVLDMVGQSQNRQIATDVGVYGHYVNLTSNTTADASNELFAFFSENLITVAAATTNSKTLVGSSQTLSRGDGTDDGTLDGLIGHESFLRINSGASGITGDSFGFLSLVQAQSGTATNFYHFRSVPIEAGGTITNHYGVYIASDSTTPVKNWLADKVKLGGTSYAAPSGDVGVELAAPTKFPGYDTVSKLALSVDAGTQVFDTTLNQMSYYNGTAWVNI